uniref:flagellar biosynthesis protein FlhF n=1 Tax=Halarcobacter sp. TaxID=2321133 RepID=UPI003A933E8E
SNSDSTFSRNNNDNNDELNSILTHLTYPLLEYLDNNSHNIYKRLIDLGYEDNFSIGIIKELSRNIEGEIQLDEALNLIASKINHVNLLEKKISQKIYGFIGPSGSGKTTTLLKFATIHKIIHSSKILVINANNYNFGDKEILKAQTKSIKVDYKSIDKLADLNETIKKSKGYDLVLIDCDSEVKTLTNQIENILVLQTTLSKSYLNVCLKDYDYKYLALTFIDKHLSIQNIIDSILDSEKPLVFYSNGGSIPDDFEVFDQSVLMKFLVENVG